MATRRYITGGTGIAVSSDLHGLIDHLVRTIPGGIGKVLEAAGDKVAANAEVTVPVKSGKLRDSIHTTTAVKQDSIAVGVGIGSSSVDYAYYVKAKKGQYAGKSVYQEAIRKPAIKATSEIIRDGTDLILREAKKGGGK